MTLKIGLEKEFFVLSNGRPQLVPPGIPHDDCGWLAEARGEPFYDIYQAIFSLMGESARMKDRLKKDFPGVILEDIPVLKIPKELRIKAGRIYQKGLVQYQNFYGHDDHATTVDESTAGIHISFTNPREAYSDGKVLQYHGNFDWPRIFVALDQAFREEIKKAKRRPGFYEVKSDGRVEYRSLPANVNLGKVIDVLSSVLKT